MADSKEQEALIARIPILAWIGMRHVDSGDPEIFSIEIDLNDNLDNGAGTVHGGVIATLIDHTGGTAVEALAGRRGPTVNLHIHYLASARSGPLRAEARIVKAGRHLVVTETRVLDGEGRLLATASMTTFVTTIGNTPPG
jgi:uncharacterized protein (TIGR00369 family)